MKTESHPKILNSVSSHLIFFASMVALFFISRLEFFVFHLITEL